MHQWEYMFFTIDAYEYKVHDIDSPLNGKPLREVLPDLGAAGWELVSVGPVGGTKHVMYFKRPVHQSV